MHAATYFSGIVNKHVSGGVHLLVMHVVLLMKAVRLFSSIDSSKNKRARESDGMYVHVVYLARQISLESEKLAKINNSSD